ncbi:B12-binding domain-containing radical SAM protein [Flavilitoribacter nigricans]|uniref:Radical SAM protein n=1 Tax=Flavilitoribacter nigricans (strain ATCC 23147 / DSM 23189 / NBRC 102662 / NCIMB 1420 / SS-2) TaxID=1122177 RepID=A0A2D0MWQ0_FLAN2|nr:radical SAM protein [Flavilitoribacter nigricans]PHN00610.1 radical SAM protein [Flavilitoribacter nigricans DSM 23189 = NBRC 102662]
MKTLLITPPFTQLNTPYPATAYLKGFLATRGIAARQADLGIEVILRVFSRDGLEKLFAAIPLDAEVSENAQRIIQLKDYYRQTIEPVIRFLQDKDPMLAHVICDGEYLPEAGRFAQLDDLEWAFGSLGIRDKARHLATLYLEDLADLIKELVDPHFGFSRYAERLARTATSFDPLYDALRQPLTFIDEFLLEILADKMEQQQPEVVGMSIPFPGNLYGGLRCGQWIKQHFPDTRIIMGGGYVNTELRSLGDERLFEFVDFVTLDDGEAPIWHLFEYFSGTRKMQALKRTFALQHGVVQYFNGSTELDVPQREVGTPDYGDFQLDQFLSVIEIANPMHRLWSDGRWNKLTLAHGCYWGKCSFCDVTLDYIKRYEPVNAALLCDRIETIIAQTGQRGFHFVDEAAPPALMRDLALEIIKRGISISWWTNIRFEQSFTEDLCHLLAASGCIAVSGGLEVASDRLLALMKKGVTVAQVARVSRNFTAAGILVHAYLMYGFPTQTDQETIDSLEMVRQIFEQGIVQSGFWHQFAMTAHSPVGLSPAQYQVTETGPGHGSFANNDLYHDDPSGAEHERYSEGLKKSLFNYMHGICLDYPLQEWFDFRVPEPSIPHDYIYQSILDEPEKYPNPNSKLIWLGGSPSLYAIDKRKKGKWVKYGALDFHNKKTSWTLQLPVPEAEWLENILPQLVPDFASPFTFRQLEENYAASQLGSFHDFFASEAWRQLRENGLLIV